MKKSKDMNDRELLEAIYDSIFEKDGKISKELSGIKEEISSFGNAVITNIWNVRKHLDDTIEPRCGVEGEDKYDVRIEDEEFLRQAKKQYRKNDSMYF